MTDDTREEAHRPKKKQVYKPAAPTRPQDVASVARGGARRPKPAPQRHKPAEEVVDADLAWIQDTLKSALYVGDILTRRDQYMNKVMSLKRKFAQGKERDYAGHIELLCEKLRHYPMQAMLRDVLRDDAQLKKIRFFR